MSKADSAPLVILSKQAPVAGLSGDRLKLGIASRPAQRHQFGTPQATGIAGGDWLTWPDEPIRDLAL